jgi:hypothetical protein
VEEKLEQFYVAQVAEKRLLRFFCLENFRVWRLGFDCFLQV